MSGEKKHEPTQKKLDDARKEGQVARTKDFGAWAVIAGGFATIPIVVDNAKPAMIRVFTTHLPKIASDPRAESVLQPLQDVFYAVAFAMIPLVAVAVVFAILGTAVQGGIKIADKALKPKFKNLNPWNGIKNMFSVKTLWEATKSLIKVGVLTYVIYYIISTMTPALMAAGALSLNLIISTTLDAVVSVVQIGVFMGLALAAVDYVVTKKQMHKKLRMSDQDIKDEHKQAEGDPQLKGAIKSRQMAMSRNRMMAEVTEADAVLVNPTHIAVAIKYDPESFAPNIVATGQGFLATKIREKADEAGVPIVQDIPLARALFYSCELGRPIPVELYEAVASVLAFVMRLKARGTPSGIHTLPGGAPNVPEERTHKTFRLPRQSEDTNA